MRAVITVIGKDQTGIIARVSNLCYVNSVNILDISQSIMQELFTMIMLTDISNCKLPFAQFVDEMDRLGKDIGVTVHTVHEDVFQSMHKI